MIVEINDKVIKITKVIKCVKRVFTEEHPDGYVIGLEVEEEGYINYRFFPLSRYELLNVKVGL